ncbi:hypothetical protein KRR26_35135 [Corallococcus sp. M34]|nr:hypothetical protein [Citreicoccus inhibens]
MSRIESSTTPVLPEPTAADPVACSSRSGFSSSSVSARSDSVRNSVEVFRGEKPLPNAMNGGAARPRSGEGNQFDFAIGGMFPPKPTGNLREQAKQGALTAMQSEAAAASQLLRGGAAVDAYARQHLKMLDASPPIAGAPTSLTDYASVIPGVSAETAYRTFVREPNALFGAAGIVLRPATSSLADGAKLFLEEKGMPPVWAPISVHLDAQNRTVHITTLDGHPLRGTNRFVFEDDGRGGTRVRQYSAFQGSSPATSVGLTLMDPIERQHDIWRSVHGKLHDMLRAR